MSRIQQDLGIIAYIALGSNIEDREHYLKEAIAALNTHPDIQVTWRSGIYETEPVGYVEQDPFLNMVISIRTTLSPTSLLITLQDIERQLGRTRDVRWGPRTLDLDMLLYGHEQLTTPDLIIPHPRMHERAFVLVPLAEVLQAQQDPMQELVLAQLKNLDGKDGIILWNQAT